jgi:type IV secretory pathway protease TraF
VLVWTKKPLVFRNELVAVDGLAVEVATASDDRGRALGPLAAAAPPLGGSG